MIIAQKIKIIPVLCLLWALPMSLLPRVTANTRKPRTTAPATSPNEAQLKMSATENYGKLPLSFERNQGQSADAVKFLSRGSGYTLFLTPTEAVFSLRNTDKRSALHMKLIGADANVQLNGEQELQGKVNYLIGNDRSKWHTGISTFRKVHYDNVWSGVDMLWYGSQTELEYDFVIKPGTEVSTVRVAFEGAEKVRLDDQGNLMIASNGEEVKHLAPVVYQEREEGRLSVAGKYVIKGANEIGFEVGDYDHSKPLVIDPVLIYSSYIGGSLSDQGFTVAANANGEAFVAGATSSDASSFPLKNAFNSSQTGTLGFITRMNANGTDTIYSTFFGASTDDCTQGVCGTEIRGIAVAADGKISITGAVDNFNNESDFPLTANAFQKNGFCIAVCGLEPDRLVDAFVTMLSADGSQLLYSSFFGGSASASAGNTGRAFEAGNAIAIDSSNRIYITGPTGSNNLPTKHAFQWSRHSEFGGFDAFIAVFNPNATSGNASLLYSSYYGGDGDEIGKGVAVDNDRNAYIVGSTASTDLETKSAASVPLQATFQGGATDGFVAKIDTEADGDSSLTYSTYFGGNINDRVEAVAVDSLQRAYITGASNSSPTSFPLKNAFDSSQQNGEAFVAKLNADGTALFYCSFLGGNNGNTSADGEEGLGLTIDFGGNVYVTGRTTSGATFPQLLPLAVNFTGTAFLTKIAATISNNTVPKILYSSTFGGSSARGKAVALDTRGNVYLAGTTTDGLTTTAGAFDTTFNGGLNDAFVAKFNSTFNDSVGVFQAATNQFLERDQLSSGPADRAIVFGQPGDLPVVGDWNGSGVDNVGVFRPSTGQFLLQVTRKIIVVNFGQAGDIPVAGDWDGNGVDTPGVFNPANGQWQLTNGINGLNVANSFPQANFTFTFGQNGDVPIVGDWDGNGIDGVGFFRAGNSTFNLSNGFQGTVDIKPFIFGALGVKPLAGDWNGDGIATIGVFNPNTGTMSLNNVNSPGNGIGDIVFNFGQGADVAIAGDWDGKPSLP